MPQALQDFSLVSYDGSLVLLGGDTRDESGCWTGDYTFEDFLAGTCITGKELNKIIYKLTCSDVRNVR